MSADNSIAILITTDNFRQYGNTLHNTFGEGVTTYRVAHIQAIDNWQWYKDNELHNLGVWMYREFKDAQPLYTKKSADDLAEKLLNTIGYVEYGIQEIDAREFNFPGY